MLLICTADEQMWDANRQSQQLADRADVRRPGLQPQLLCSHAACARCLADLLAAVHRVTC